MKRLDVFEKMVADTMDGYQWNARKRKSPVNLTAFAATLLRRQHAKVRSAVLAYRRALNYGHVVPGDRHARGMVDGSIETCTAILAALDRLAGKKGVR